MTKYEIGPKAPPTTVTICNVIYNTLHEGDNQVQLTIVKMKLEMMLRMLKFEG